MLKRLHALFLLFVVFLFLSACSFVSSDNPNPKQTSSQPISDKEILFSEIPWGSNPKIANEKMGGDMVISDEHYIKDWSCAYNLFSFGQYPAGYALIGSVPEVAGYSNIMTYMYFMYSHDAEINRDIDRAEFYLAQYQFDVADINASYDDLKTKLSTIYGKGLEETEITSHLSVSVVGNGYSGTYETLEKKTTWIGTNGTQLVLMASILQDNVEVQTAEFLFLTYGETDIEPQLNSLYKAIEEENVQKENDTRTSENTNGL